MPLSLRTAFALAVFGLLPIPAHAQEPDEVLYKNKPASHWLKRLQSADVTARREAIEALAKIGPHAPSAVPGLIRALDDDNSAVRLGSISALGQIGPAAKEAVPALLAITRDADPAFCEAAVRSLGQIGPADDGVGPAFAKLFATTDSPAIRNVAYETLRVLGPKAKAAIPILKEQAESADSGRRQALATLLGKMGPDAVPILLELRKDPAENVRVAAHQALVKMGPDAKAALPALTKSFRDSKEVDLAAMQIITAIGADALPVMVEALNHPNSNVSQMAASGLGALGSAGKPAIPALVEALMDPPTATTASTALVRIGPDAIPAILEATRNKDIRGRAFDVLREMGPRALPAAPTLVARLKEDDASRQFASQVLQALDAEAMPALLEGVADVDNEAASEVVRNVCSRHPERVKLTIPTLVKLLQHENPTLRLRAVQLLGQFPAVTTKDALPALRKAAEDKVARVRTAAEQAVKYIEAAHSSGGKP